MNSRLLSVRFVASPIALINVGIAPIIKGLHLVLSLIPSLGEVIQIGVRIGPVVELTSVTTNIMIMIITITGSTIR